jgi:HK97 family phage major capsid protein
MYNNSLELEVSLEIEKTIPATIKRHGGLYIPFSLPMQSRAGLDTVTSTKGKELVFTEAGPFIDYLYNKMVVRQLGAEVIDNLQSNLGFPKQTGKVTGAWVAENPLSDVTDSSLLLGQIPISPKTYCASTSYSRQLLVQSTPKIDEIVAKDLATDAALALDAAALIGTGAAAHQPVGIMNTTGVQSYTLAGDTGNGAVPTYVDILAMEELIETANADTLASLGWATTPPIKTKLKQTARSTDIALPVWMDSDTMAGYAAECTNQLPKNLTHGTGTNLSPLIFGAWDSIALGLWGAGFEIVVDPYMLKKQAGQIEVTAFLFADVAVRQPAAFVVSKYCAKS